jgi:hypothetical protein
MRKRSIAQMFATKPLLAHKRTMRNGCLVIPMQAGERIKSGAARGLIYL